MNNEYTQSSSKLEGGDALRRALASNRDDERVVALLEMIIARLDRLERAFKERTSVINNVTYRRER